MWSCGLAGPVGWQYVVPFPIGTISFHCSHQSPHVHPTNLYPSPPSPLYIRLSPIFPFHHHYPHHHLPTITNSHRHLTPTIPTSLHPLPPTVTYLPLSLPPTIPTSHHHLPPTITYLPPSPTSHHHLPPTITYLPPSPTSHCHLSPTITYLPPSPTSHHHLTLTIT